MTADDDGRPQIEEWGDSADEFGSPAPTRYSFSLLHELAKDPDNHLEEVEPGVFTVQKTTFGREA